MSVTTTVPSPAELARHFDAALGPDPLDGSLLIRLEAAPDGPTVGVVHLDCGTRHPVDALLGLRAEPSWKMVGIVAHARVHRLAPPDDGAPPSIGHRTQPGTVPVPVRITHVVARDGTVASTVRHLDGSERIDELSGGEGHLVDACQRILGLPTAPPPVPPLHWYAACWLDALLAEVAADPRGVPTWAAAARLHPLALRRGGTPEQFARQIRSVAGAASWNRLRGRAITGDGAWPVGREIAEWMDNGMFARWLLAELPDPVDLLIDLAGLLPAPVVRGLVVVLESWDLW